MPFHGYAASISRRAALRIGAAVVAIPVTGELATIRPEQVGERYIGEAGNCENAILFVLDHPVLGRLDTAGSELFMPADQNDAELSVGTHFRKQTWITTNEYAQDFPFYVLLGGGEDDGGEVVRGGRNFWLGVGADVHGDQGHQWRTA